MSRDLTPDETRILAKRLMAGQDAVRLSDYDRENDRLVELRAFDQADGSVLVRQYDRMPISQEQGS